MACFGTWISDRYLPPKQRPCMLLLARTSPGWGFASMKQMPGSLFSVSHPTGIKPPRDRNRVDEGAQLYESFPSSPSRRADQRCGTIPKKLCAEVVCESESQLFQLASAGFGNPGGFLCSL